MDFPDCTKGTAKMQIRLDTLILLVLSCYGSFLINTEIQTKYVYHRVNVHKYEICTFTGDSKIDENRCEQKIRTKGNGNFIQVYIIYCSIIYTVIYLFL